jgi:hypothetical protein
MSTRIARANDSLESPVLLLPGTSSFLPRLVLASTGVVQGDLKLSTSQKRAVLPYWGWNENCSQTHAGIISQTLLFL